MWLRILQAVLIGIIVGLALNAALSFLLRAEPAPPVGSDASVSSISPVAG